MGRFLKNIIVTLFYFAIVLCLKTSIVYAGKYHQHNLQFTHSIQLNKAEVSDDEEIYPVGIEGGISAGLSDSDLSFNSREDGSTPSIINQRKSLKSKNNRISLNKIKLTLNKTFLSDFFPRI